MTNEDETLLTPPDLSKTFPRSPRDVIGGYVIAARTLDKCRASIAGTLGEYQYDCPLDNVLFDFTGLNGDQFREFVATGASDDEVGEWINANATKRERIAVIKWNNEMRDQRISELPDKLQEFLEDYILENVPSDRPVYVWFDVYDIEEDRL